MRNNVISICKGIAIILMVLGHTEGPGFLMHIVYLFHMPIFFITAGYFFSRKYLSDPWTFVVKRFKGLYVPMVKWALFFLVIHNQAADEPYCIGWDLDSFHAFGQRSPPACADDGIVSRLL